MNKLVVITLLVILAAPQVSMHAGVTASTSTAQTDFPSTDAFVKSVLIGEGELSNNARGDLNSDGLEDWVGVIHRRPANAAPTYQLYVLLRSAGGTYRLAEKTQEAEIAGMGCCWLEDLQVRRGSIYIQNNAKTAATMEAARHQFKLHRGQWRLVGIQIYFTDHTPSAPANKDTEMNLLTGLVIEKTQKGERKPITRRRKKTFKAHFLKDFDFLNGFGIEQ